MRFKIILKHKVTQNNSTKNNIILYKCQDKWQVKGCLGLNVQLTTSSGSSAIQRALASVMRQRDVSKQSRVTLATPVQGRSRQVRTTRRTTRVTRRPDTGRKITGGRRIQRG